MYMKALFLVLTTAGLRTPLLLQYSLMKMGDDKA